MTAKLTALLTGDTTESCGEKETSHIYCMKPDFLLIIIGIDKQVLLLLCQ